MKVLVTGAKGFVGRNLVETLKCVRDGKDRRAHYAPLLPLEVFEYDRDSSAADLERFCAEADFVFNLAGVNRPKDSSEFMEGNFGFASELLGALERAGNRCPVMLASSAQASLEGRFAGSEYGRSKLAGERLFRDYAERTGADILVYRFPNVFGKWCRPNYNSAVATFCNNVARGLPVRVDDPATDAGAKAQRLHALGVEVLRVPQDDAGRVAIRPLLHALGEKGIDSLLVEGGSGIHGAFFDEGAVDEAVVYLAPKVVGGADAPGPVAGAGAARMAEAVVLGRPRAHALGDDLKITFAPAGATRVADHTPASRDALGATAPAMEGDDLCSPAS